MWNEITYPFLNFNGATIAIASRVVDSRHTISLPSPGVSGSLFSEVFVTATGLATSCWKFIHARDRSNPQEYIICTAWRQKYTSEIHLSTVKSWFFFDDVIKWKHFPRYWPFVRGIHRSPVNSPHKGTRSFDIFLDLRLNKRFGKQRWGWWFETSSHPLWRHCNAYISLAFIIEGYRPKNFNKGPRKTWHGLLFNLQTWAPILRLQRYSKYQTAREGSFLCESTSMVLFLFISVNSLSCFMRLCVDQF